MYIFANDLTADHKMGCLDSRPMVRKNIAQTVPPSAPPIPPGYQPEAGPAVIGSYGPPYTYPMATGDSCSSYGSYAPSSVQHSYVPSPYPYIGPQPTQPTVAYGTPAPYGQAQQQSYTPSPYATSQQQMQVPPVGLCPPQPQFGQQFVPTGGGDQGLRMPLKNISVISMFCYRSLVLKGFIGS